MGCTRLVYYAAALCLSGLTLPALAQTKLGKAEMAAIAASPEEVASVAAVKNDSLDSFVTITTEPFYKFKPGLWGQSIESDKFIRAFVDKKTGDVRFQVYVWLVYKGEFQLFDSASFETPSGPETARLTRINSTVLGCGRYGCSTREDVAFSVPEATLRAISAGAKAGVGDQWNFKISGKFGDVRAVMLKTEIAGILLAADRQKASLQK